MVNRILIRIKVVQMLYAYLLTRTEFRIDTNPDLSSVDKRFAYSTYIDLLMLLLELTGHRTTPASVLPSPGQDRRLAESAVGVALSSDPVVKEWIFKGKHKSEVVNNVISDVREAITESTIYRETLSNGKFTLSEEVEMWQVLFATTIATNPTLIRTLRSLPDFSEVGFEMAVNKVIETLKSFYGTRAGYHQAMQSLEASLLQAHKLYISLFDLIIRLTHAEENRIENARAKYLATAEDKNPNMRFVENSFAATLAESRDLEKLVKDYAIDWTSDITFLNSLLKTVRESKIYADYMNAKTTDWTVDCEFWRSLMKDVILPSDELAAALEDESVYWNDDLHIIGTFVLKSIRTDANSEPGELKFLPRYKDEEDSRFGAELFEAAVRNRDEYMSLIQRFVDTSNWDSERIAFMDSVIMVCALAEIVNFPNIPLAVSLNEYIDIANMYSSPKSGQFINGIMSSAVRHLHTEGVIMK